ncbi:MAG: hypothetical protein ACKVOT_14170 [Polaromonas sp.]
MSGLLAGWSTRLVVCATLAALGYWAGDHQRNNAWLAKQAVTERAADKQYRAEVARSDAATAELIAVQRQHTSNYQQFEKQFNDLRNRTPLLARRPVRVHAPGGDGGLAERADAHGDADRGQSDALSAGAVWMWNTALTGSDQPAGACGALDTSPAACAAATAVTINDAWDNHTANAQICAANRLAHQHLIDFVNQTPDALYER